MNIHQVNLDHKNERNDFLQLPFNIYRNYPQWVPPLEMDARRMLNPREHPFYQHSEAAFFLAYNAQQQPIGRLAVLNNRPFNQFNRLKRAHFYLFECFDHPQIARALFDAAFTWARQRDLVEVHGPKGFLALDGMGLLVKGFEHRPAFGIPYHPPYYANLLEMIGFQAVSEVVSGYLDTSFRLPPKILQVANLVEQRRGLNIAHFRNRRELLAMVPKFKDLYNQSLGGTQGNRPLTDQEAQSMANQLKWFADPNLIKIVLKEEQPVGFLFAYPDVSAALQRTQGKIFPLGWLEILREMRRTKWININGAGMTEKYRGLGGTAILFREMYRSFKEGGFQYADLVQIGVENGNMQRELRDLGVDFYKTHCMYQINL
jgi:hypothetical protein